MLNPENAITAINQAGALLVFPIKNQKQPKSLWSSFFPRSAMKWKWDETGDDRVADLWHLRGELSTSRAVVYTKWYRGRATYFSRDVFVALLRALNPSPHLHEYPLNATACRILTALESESPLSTKVLKEQVGLSGRAHQAEYDRALKTLWSRLLIVAFGEVDDGAFPSLAVGSTQNIFEELWREAFSLKREDSEHRLARKFQSENPFFKFYQKLSKLDSEGSDSLKSKPALKSKLSASIRFDEIC